MYIVTLRIKVPKNQRKNFLDASRMVIEPTLVQTGCISCRFYQDLNDPDAALLVEEWKTRKDLEHHFKSDRFRIVLSLIELSEETPEFKISTIGKIEGFEVLEDIRETA